jgi:predicted dehydrogenase
MGEKVGEKVRWGVLGAGGIARRRVIPEGLLPADNALLIAVCSPHSGIEVAKQFGVSACASEAQLLDSGCDAVYVATPVHLHEQQVTAAAAAGKHVLCEKPLAMNVQEAERMVEACERARVKLGVGLFMRFNSRHVEAKRLIDRGAIGRPVLGRAQLACWYPPIAAAWRQRPDLGGGGSLMDLACHTIDLLETFLGRARRVSCSTGSLVHAYAVEDTALTLIEFDSGARGIVDALFNIPDQCSANRLELYGAAGSIVAEGTIGQGPGGEMWLRSDLRANGYDASQSRERCPLRAIDVPPVNTYRAQIEAFSHAVLNDSDPPIDGRAGLWNQRVLAACYESARDGRMVEV